MPRKIAIVGEAWGEAEERARAPFVGAGGRVLNQLLEEAGIRRADCLVTDVFNLRPQPNNDIVNLCTSKKECGHDLGPIKQGKYIKAEYIPELDRLFRELSLANPTIIIALGSAAIWAFTGTGGISSRRGTIMAASRGVNCKLLPTYHPSAIIRDFSLKHVTLFDLMKAERESHFPEIRRPQRFIHTEPTLDDLYSFEAEYITKSNTLAFDIETAASAITCIGFAPSVDRALVIPFRDGRQPGGSYWPDAASEKLAWAFVARILQNASAKVTQNGLYDVNFLWSKYGIRVNNWSDDTMLLHHALHPESQKGLGFLGSVYTNEASWKIMRNATIKRES